MSRCVDPHEQSKAISPGAKVKISEDAEEEALDTQDDMLVKSKHAGEEGRYIEDIVTQCRVRFAVVELADGTRIPIRKQFVVPLPSGGRGAA